MIRYKNLRKYHTHSSSKPLQPGQPIFSTPVICKFNLNTSDDLIDESPNSNSPQRKALEKNPLEEKIG